VGSEAFLQERRFALLLFSKIVTAELQVTAIDVASIGAGLVTHPPPVFPTPEDYVRKIWWALVEISTASSGWGTGNGMGGVSIGSFEESVPRTKLQRWMRQKAAPQVQFRISRRRRLAAIRPTLPSCFESGLLANGSRRRMRD